MVVYDVMDKIGTDKSRSPGNNDIFKHIIYSLRGDYSSSLRWLTQASISS